MDNLFKDIKKQLFNKKFLLVIFLIILATTFGSLYLSENFTFILQILPALTILIIEIRNIEEFNKKDLRKVLKEQGALIYSMLSMLIIMASIKFNAIYLISISPALSLFLLGGIDEEDEKDEN